MIILTGGAGFIGTNTLMALNQSGHDDIVVVDNIGDTQKWKNLVGRSFRHYVPKEQLWDWLARNQAGRGRARAAEGPVRGNKEPKGRGVHQHRNHAADDTANGSCRHHGDGHQCTDQGHRAMPGQRICSLPGLQCQKPFWFQGH